MTRTSGDPDRLDRAFTALADPVRRAIIARLSTGPATVNELAEPFPITVQAVSQHVHVLEQAGLVTRTRQAQRRPVHLDPAALESVTAWIDTYRLRAERSYRRLDAVLETLKEES
jgi:DNA-binding transcriptional ArsR family regulator